MKTYRGIIFDFDNTLVDSERIYVDALATVGFKPDAPDYKRARTRVKERLGAGHVCSHNRLLYFKELDDAAPEPLGANAILTRMQRYESALGEEVAATWKKLARDALFEKLAQRYRLAILTNENTRTQLMKLQSIDPHRRYFQRMVCSEEWGVEKPDLRLFKAAAATLGLPPAACLVVGDNPEHDIEPALALGMDAILTCEFTPRRPVPCTTIERLDALGEMLL